MDQKWTRVEGMIIGRGLDPESLAEDLRERSVLAQLEWFPTSPQLLGINLALAEGHIGRLEDTQLVAGPTPEELAEELATLFDAEVRIGTASSDYLPQGEAVPAGSAGEAMRDDQNSSDQDADNQHTENHNTTRHRSGQELDEETSASRIVEIGRTPASSVPLLAALEGIDLADIELPEGHRALLAELEPDKAGWNFGELPLVTLSWADDELQAFLVTDDHLEHVVTHNWGMDSVLVPGAQASVDELDPEIIDLVGDRCELKAIAGAVPGADADALLASAGTSGPEAVRLVVKALALPDSVADFLLGRIPAEEVEGADMHLARGISNAIGRSVDIMLSEPDSPAQPLWSTYQSLAVEKPWVVRAIASTEAILGTTLLTLAVRGESPRSRWLKAGGVLGSILLIDSIAEISLSSYLRRRHSRFVGD